MGELPAKIHSIQQVRAIDRYAIDVLEIPGYTLMTRAGAAAVCAMHRFWPNATRIVVLCGFGNNAGDGYVVARLAQAESNAQVDVIALGDPAQLSGDAQQAWSDFCKDGGATSNWDEGLLASADVIVDAIFGTGLARTLSPELVERVQAVNRAECPIFALDVPSGLNADSGVVMGAAIRATRTMTFVGLKQGFYLGEGPDHTGVLSFDGLEIPVIAENKIGCVATRITTGDVERVLPTRRRTAHKGDGGRVLIVGSNRGMGGAIRLAGEACLRVGAGLVTAATRAENVPPLVAGRPELICRAIERVEDLQPLIAWATVIAIGPGLAQDDWSRTMLSCVLRSEKPLVIDADGLNLLAENPIRRSNWILTPHPGEAGRLLGIGTLEIQHDRMGSARAIVERYGGITILKGAGTVVMKANELPAICDRGNPGMATPGMGDVLTGVVAGIAAQSKDLWAAANAAVFVHASAGDLAARGGERGLIASDLFPHFQACVNPSS